MEYTKETKELIETLYNQNIGQNIKNIPISNQRIIEELNNMIETNNYNKSKIIILIRQFIKNINNNITVYIGNSKNCNGYHSDDNNIIFINENLIDKFIKEKSLDKYHLFETIFHELTHANQFNELKQGNYSNKNIEMIIDEIIIKHYPEYYDNNYLNISYEYDARVNSYLLNKEFICKNFGVSEEEINNYYKEKLEENKSHNNIIRKSFNEEKNLYEIISKLVSLKPVILEEYPLLKNYLSVEFSNLKPLSK